MAMVDYKEGGASGFVFLVCRWLYWLQNAIPRYGGARPPFIGAAEVATRSGARCTAAGVSMDSVHGRKATIHQGRLVVAAEYRGGAHDDVRLGA